MKLSDSTFLQQFENLSLDPQHFNHCGHLRLTWLYLNQYSLEISLDKIAGGITRYASSLGASEKFHATITEALVRIVARRMRQFKPRNWDEFQHQNEDLFTDSNQVLRHYYSDQLLNSEQAKNQFMQPDEAHW